MRYEDPDPENAMYVVEINSELENIYPFNNLFLNLKWCSCLARGTTERSMRSVILKEERRISLFRTILHYAFSTGFDIDQCYDDFMERSLSGVCSLGWPKIRPRQKALEAVCPLYIYLRKRGFKEVEIIV